MSENSVEFEPHNGILYVLDLYGKKVDRGKVTFSLKAPGESASTGLHPGDRVYMGERCVYAEPRTPLKAPR